MGLTPLEGLVMGTRSGDIDPAIAFYLADHGYDVEALNKLCNKRAACWGSRDSRTTCGRCAEEAAAGNERAELAIEMFCYRLKKYIGAYYAAVGELTPWSSPAGSAKTPRQFGLKPAKAWNRWESSSISECNAANCRRAGTSRSVRTKSRVQVLVIPTDEEGGDRRRNLPPLWQTP